MEFIDDNNLVWQFLKDKLTTEGRMQDQNKARLTEDQLNFLRSQGIPLSKVFDATGLKPGVYQPLMKELGMIVAYGVSRCRNAGHTLKLRSGHCPQCKTANIAFLARFDDPGYVYIATSNDQSLVKVGTSNDADTRIARINAYGYGGASDWVIRHRKKYPKAGQIEYKAHVILNQCRVFRRYNKDGNIVECQELFKCDLPVAIAAVEQAAKSAL